MRWWCTLVCLPLSIACASTPAAPPIAGRQELTRATAPVSRGCPQAAEQFVTSAVRSSDAQLRSLLSVGCRQSPTLRRLAEAIGRTDGVVYIVAGPCPLRALRGCLLHTIADTGHARYLWIRLNTNAGWRELLGTAAHELHHALELLSRSTIRSERDVLDFYRSIDVRASGATARGSPYRTYETSVAIDVGLAVRSELADVSEATAAEDRD